MSTQKYSVTQHPISTLLTWIQSCEIENMTVDDYQDFLVECRILIAEKIKAFFESL